MGDWISQLKHDPIDDLLSEEDIALKYRVERDILKKKQGSPEEPLTDDTLYRALVRKQKPDGSWRESGRKKSEDNWTFIATLRSMLNLLDRGSGNGDEVFDQGALYLLGTQSEEGDFRGAYGADIPGPGYTGMVLDVLYRGGVDEPEQIQKAVDWLLDIRRTDGGWAIPTLRTKSKSDPSSHCVTGMALRGFASAPDEGIRKEVQKAGDLLANRIFKPDKYPDRRGVEYWGKLSYPFWFTDALSALDVLSRLGFDLSAGRIKRAYKWLIKQQNNNGYWESNFHRSNKEPDPWLTYAALKILQSFSE